MDGHIIMSVLCMMTMSRDTQIILFKVPIMLCSNPNTKPPYAQVCVPVMLSELKAFFMFDALTVMIIIAF